MTSFYSYVIVFPAFMLLLGYGYARFLSWQDDRDAARKKTAKDGADAWKQTVRAIYDELHFGPDSVFRGQQQVACMIVGMIEARHPDYFCAAREATDAE